MSNGSNAALKLPFDEQADQAGEVETLPGVERSEVSNPFLINTDEVSEDEINWAYSKLEEELISRFEKNPTQGNGELLDQFRFQRDQLRVKPQYTLEFFQAVLEKDQDAPRLGRLRPVNYLSTDARDAREAAAAGNPVGYQHEALKAEFEPV